MRKKLLLVGCCLLVLAFLSVADESLADEVASQGAVRQNRYSNNVDRPTAWKNWLPSLPTAKCAFYSWALLSGSFLPASVAAQSNNTGNDLLRSSDHVSGPYGFSPSNGNQTSLSFHTQHNSLPSAVGFALLRKTRGLPDAGPEVPRQVLGTNPTNPKLVPDRPSKATEALLLKYRDNPLKSDMLKMTDRQMAIQKRKLENKFFLSSKEKKELRTLKKLEQELKEKEEQLKKEKKHKSAGAENPAHRARGRHHATNTGSSESIVPLLHGDKQGAEIKSRVRAMTLAERSRRQSYLNGKIHISTDELAELKELEELNNSERANPQRKPSTVDQPGSSRSYVDNSRSRGEAGESRPTGGNKPKPSIAPKPDIDKISHSRAKAGESRPTGGNKPKPSIAPKPDIDKISHSRDKAGVSRPTGDKQRKPQIAKKPNADEISRALSKSKKTIVDKPYRTNRVTAKDWSEFEAFIRELSTEEMASGRARVTPAFPTLEPSGDQPSTSRGHRCRRSAGGTCGVSPKGGDKAKAVAFKKTQQHIKTASFDDLTTEYARGGAIRVGNRKYFRVPRVSSKGVAKFTKSTIRVAGKFSASLMPAIGLADVAQIGVEGTIYVFDNLERWQTQHHLEAQFRQSDDIYGALSIFFGNPVVDLIMPKDMEADSAKAFVEEQLVWMIKEVAKVERSYLPTLIIPPGPIRPEMSTAEHRKIFDQPVVQSGLELDAVRDLPVQIAEVDLKKQVFTRKEYADDSVLLACKSIFDNGDVFFLIAKKDAQGNLKAVSMGTGLNILNARLERLEETLIELQKRLAVIQNAYTGHIYKEVKVPSFGEAHLECLRKKPNMNMQGAACGIELKRKIRKLAEKKREADRHNRLYESHLQVITDGIVKSLLEEHARLVVSIGELKAYAGISSEASTFQQRMRSLINAGHFHELERVAREQSLQDIHDIPEAGSDEAQSNRQKVHEEIAKASRGIDRFLQHMPPRTRKKLLKGMEGASQCNADNPYIEIKKQLLAESLAVPDEITTEKIRIPFQLSHYPGQYLKSYAIQTVQRSAEGLVPELIEYRKIFSGVYEGPRESRLNGPLQDYLQYSTDKAIKAFFVRQPVNEVVSGQAVYFATVTPANGHVQHWQRLTTEELMAAKMCPSASSSQAPRKLLGKLKKSDKQSFTNAALAGNHNPRLVITRSGEATDVIGSMLAPVLSLKNNHFNSSGYLRVVPFYKYTNGHLYLCQTSEQAQEAIRLDRYQVDWPEASLPQLHKIEMVDGIQTTRPVEADISWDLARDNRKIILTRRFLSELRFYPKGEVEPDKERYRASVMKRFLHGLCHWNLSITDADGAERVVARFKIDDTDVLREQIEITLDEPLEENQEDSLVFSCEYRAKQSLLPKFWRYKKTQEKRVRVSANLVPGFYRLEGHSHHEKLVVTQHNWQEKASPITMPDNANNRLVRQKTTLPRYADRKRLQHRKLWKAFYETLGDSVPEAGNFQESGVFLYKRARLEDGTIQLVPSEYISKELAVVSRPRSFRHLMDCVSRLPDLDSETFDLIVQVAIGMPRRYQQQFITEYFQPSAQPMPVVDNTIMDQTTNASQTMPTQAPMATDSTPASRGHINRKLMAQTPEVFDEDLEAETTHAANQAYYNTVSIPGFGLAVGAGLLINGLGLTTGTVDSDVNYSSSLISTRSLSRWLYINQRIYESSIQTHPHTDGLNERLQSYIYEVYSHLVVQGLEKEIRILPMSEILETLREMPVTQFYDFIQQHSKILVAEQSEPSDDTIRITEECHIAPYSILCELFQCSRPLRKKFDKVVTQIEEIGIKKENITLSDIFDQIKNWEDFPEINLPLTVYRDYQKMTAISALESTILIKKGDENAHSQLMLDAHGGDCYQKLLKMKNDNVLTKDVMIKSSVYGFFQQEIVKDLLNYFYSECYLSREDETLTKKRGGYISDFDFYNAVNSSLKRKRRHITVNAFLNGTYTFKEGQNVSIMDIPDALIKKYMTVVLGDEQSEDKNTIEYKKIEKYIAHCREQLAFVLAKLSQDPAIYLPALPDYKRNDNESGGEIAAQFLPSQKHSIDQSLMSNYLNAFKNRWICKDKQSVSAWRLIRMNEPAPDYVRQTNFMYDRRRD